MSSLIHTKRLALPGGNADDTHSARLGPGKKHSNVSTCIPRNTELYEKPVLLVIIFFMFGLNLSVHFYCANYLMSHL